VYLSVLEKMLSLVVCEMCCCYLVDCAVLLRSGRLLAWLVYCMFCVLLVRKVRNFIVVVILVELLLKIV